MNTANEYQQPIAFHPGETLQEKLDEIEMGPKEFSLRTGKPEKTIIDVLKGRSRVTPQMAILFENVLHIPAHFWLNMQRSHDEYIARQEMEKELEESKDWARKFPYPDMAKKGWVKARRKAGQKAKELFKFFGLSSSIAWKRYYIDQELKVDFRISLAHTKKPHAVSAWLRKGELQANQLQANKFNKSGFKNSLDDLKDIMVKQPDDFFTQIQQVCLENGVKVVFTPNIKGAPINGSTRWLKSTPLIQLSDRYKRNDVFWFTFFHEIGHILLHGKKDIFIEEKKQGKENGQKEEEANEFAIKWISTKEAEKEIIENGDYSHSAILKYAEKFHTHPAIIVGRLQHLDILPFSAFKDIIVPIELRDNL